MKKTILALFVLGALSIGTVAQDQQPPVLDAILSTLSEIKTDIAVMKNDIVVIKTDIAVMKTDIAVMKTDIAVINTRLGRLDVDVQSIFNVGANIWANVLIGLSLAGGLAIIKLVWSSIANKKPKEPNAIQSSSQPELTGIRQKQRTKTRPAT